MAEIRVGRPAHLTSAQVDNMVRERYGVEEITDACAVTIASWWASPSVLDCAFTALSTTGRVEYEDLAECIHRVRRELHGESANGRALDMLSTWALDKVRDRARG